VPITDFFNRIGTLLPIAGASPITTTGQQLEIAVCESCRWTRLWIPACGNRVPISLAGRFRKYS